MNPGKLQRKIKEAKIYVHDRWLNYVTETFLLANKKIKQRTLLGFITISFINFGLSFY